MPTEEFVLIPRNMFTTAQPQVSQILNNPLTKNKSKQLSLLQRTSKQEQPEAVIQHNTEQQTDDVMQYYVLFKRTMLTLPNFLTDRYPHC